MAAIDYNLQCLYPFCYFCYVKTNTKHKMRAINCHSCSVVTSIPTIMRLHRINCSNCPKLYFIPELPNLNTLFCYNCESLERLPFLPRLSYLDCSNCSKLSNINPMESLFELICFNCANLESLPNLPSLSKLNCRDCPFLYEINIPGTLVNFLCNDCPMLHLGLRTFFKCRERAGFLMDLSRDLVFYESYHKERPRNGISTWLRKSFKLIKIDYADYLNSRTSKVVARNHELFRPGGSEYLKLLVKYKSGISG